MELPAEGPSPRAQVLGHELYDRLEVAIGELPEDYREAVVLRFFEDLSYEEIADALEVSLGTVKSRINRARRRLRESMGDLLES
jgi:RNA polymerase sigma-70 factor (ECF subfamily)